MNRTTHKQLVDRIITALKDAGVTVQRYDSITTSSTYLKLDYGVLKSVRISDHRGKKHLNYRYNLLSGITSYAYSRRDKRFYYPVKDVDRMIQQILNDRQDKQTRYGVRYHGYMMDNLSKNAHKNGFWSDAKLV